MSPALALSIGGLALAVMAHTCAVAYWGGRLNTTVEAHTERLKEHAEQLEELPCRKPHACFSKEGR